MRMVSFSRLGLATCLLFSSSFVVQAKVTQTKVAPTKAEQVRVDKSTVEQALSLRDNWLTLTRDVLMDPVWSSATDFHYTLSVDGGFVFYQQSVAQGQARIAFDHQHVAQALAESSKEAVNPLQLPFDRFSFTADKGSIQFYYQDQTWRCSLTESNCATVPRLQRAKAFGVVRDLRMAAHNPLRAAPNGAYQAQVTDDYNLVVFDQQNQVIYRTTDGTAEHFYDPESIQWAPDSSALVVMKVRPGDAHYVTRVLTAPEDQLQPRTIMQLYPKPGDAVDIDQPVLIRPAKQQQESINNRLFSHPYQLNRLQWQSDSSGFTLRYIERGHQLVRLLRVHAETGEVNAVVTDQSDTFVDQWRSYYHVLEQGEKGVIWLSEQDGWAHLYHYHLDGSLKGQITQGNWRVQNVQYVDEAKQQIWFSASGMNPDQDPYYEHYYRVNFDGTGLVALTHENAHHELYLSPDKEHYILLYSRVDLPNVAQLRRSHDDRLVRELARGDITQLRAAGFRPPQPFVSKGRDGKTDIWGLIVVPQNFDPQQKYPVIENIYAGPHDSFVPKSFWPFGFHSGGDKVIGMQAMADLGFIVVQIDGMGTSNRSKAFHDVAWQNLADSGFPDRMLWHQAAAEQFSWYNIAGGVGIYGASAGGQSTVAALLFHPEFYTTGVAYAGCYDNRMDKISWNEQWMGYPVGEHYVASSVVEHANLLEGRLLIINGEQDSNVDPASTMQLVDALVKADKDFDLLIVPGAEHSVGRSTGPIRYVQRRQFDFFMRHLQHQQTPDWNKPVP